MNKSFCYKQMAKKYLDTFIVDNVSFFLYNDIRKTYMFYLKKRIVEIV